MKKYKTESPISTLGDVAQQAHRCLHFIAEREAEPEAELRLLLEMCKQIPEPILQRCLQIQQVIELIDNFDVLPTETRLELPKWILDDLSLLGYKSN